MTTVEHARLMARYNRWMNASLYASAARLTDAQRREDRGAFFRSLHGTLNHLMLTDQVWLRRFTGLPIDGIDMKADPWADFDAMCRAREALDDDIARWVETITPAWLAAGFRYYSVAYAAHYERPAWLLVTHWFNHQTHHRGQVTTLLSQLGIDPGVTDLPVMPDA